MMRIHRPTVHQVRVCSWDAINNAQTSRHIKSFVDAAAAQLPDSAAAALRKQVQLIKLVDKSERRLLAKCGPYEVRDGAPLRMAVRIWQSGADLILHLIWRYPDSRDLDAIEAIGAGGRLLAPSTEDNWLGDGLLATAATGPSAADNERQLANIGAALMRGLEANPAGAGTAEGIRLGAGTLFVTGGLSPTQKVWPAALLFDTAEMDADPDDSDVDANVGADRDAGVEETTTFALMLWPLVVQYRLRLLRSFELFRRSEASLLRETAAQVDSLLGTDFKDLGGLMDSDSPAQAEAALARLGAAQHLLLHALGLCEQREAAMRRDLESLLRHAAQLPAFPVHTGAVAVVASSASRLALEEQTVGNLRLALEHVSADTEQGRLTATRAARALEILNTQSNLLGARYSRWVTFLLGAIGVALTLGQLVTQEAARWLYDWTVLGRAWDTFSGRPIAEGLQSIELVLFRLAVIGATTSFLLLIFYAATRRKWRRPLLIALSAIVIAAWVISRFVLLP